VAKCSAVDLGAAPSGTLSVSLAGLSTCLHCSHAVVLQDGRAGGGGGLAAGGDSHKSTVLPGKAGVSDTHMTTSDAVTASPDLGSSTSLKMIISKDD